MNKKTFSVMVLLFLGIAVAGGIYYLFFPVSMNTSEVETVYLETVDENKNIKRIDINDQHDVELFKKVIAGRAVRDNGFVFAEGGYRIVLIKPKEKIELYPYCGRDLSMMRIGSKGHLFCGPEEDSREYAALEKLLDKYLDLEEVDGIWDWK